MRILLLLVIGCIILKSAIRAQPPATATALYEQLKTDSGEQRAVLLLQVTRIEFPRNPGLSMTQVQDALTIYRKENNENGQVNAMTSLSGIYRRKNNFNLAFELDSLACQLAQQNNYLKGSAAASLNMVPMYMRAINFTKAL
ncbi:MAG: hypothetical protein ACOYVG_02860 [Bacteroidota bacterium]